MNLKRSGFLLMLLSINVLMISCQLGISEDEALVRNDGKASEPSSIAVPFSNFDRDYDGDGHADELTVVSNGISIYHPNTRKSSFYSFSGNFQINTAAEMDGKTGYEVSVVTLNGIVVICDRTKSSRLNSYSGNFSINKTTDTNGVSGKEIIVVTTNGISIIRPYNNSHKLYSITGDYKIKSVSNMDGVAGDEIVFEKGSKQYMITDRTGKTVQI